MPTIKRYKNPHLEHIRRELAAAKVRGGEDRNRHPSAHIARIQTMGRRFIERFPDIYERDYHIGVSHTIGESPVSVSIARKGTTPHERNYNSLGHAKIGFEKGTVVIETFAGTHNRETMSALSKNIGKPWPKVLLQAIEAHAHEMGFTRVMIRNPEEHYWFQHPHKWSQSLDIGIEITDPTEKKRVQLAWKQFIGIIAKQNKYKKVDGNYVKIL